MINRAGCLAKGVAYGGQIGQELIQLARRAKTEGKISELEWQKLPATPEGMVNLILSQNVEKRLIEALVDTYKPIE